MEQLDKNGLTQAEYIEKYRSKNYPKPALTPDIVLLGDNRTKLLLIKRGGHPFIGQWAFPGGFAEESETIEQTAARELEEETGYRAGKLTNLGRVSANTALFKNHFNVFLAEDLVQTGSQHLDADERIRFEELPIDEVIRRYGDAEFTHAYMGTALAFYFRWRMTQRGIF